MAPAKLSAERVPKPGVADVVGVTEVVGVADVDEFDDDVQPHVVTNNAAIMDTHITNVNGLISSPLRFASAVTPRYSVTQIVRS
jgi:hypothetical protein